MELLFKLVFDDVMLAQLKKIGEKKRLRELLSNIFDKMELLGPRAGELIDSHLFLYEIKVKHPPLRLYYKHVKETNELYLFEYEMKNSQQKQATMFRRGARKMKNMIRGFKS